MHYSFFADSLIKTQYNGSAKGVCSFGLDFLLPRRTIPESDYSLEKPRHTGFNLYKNRASIHHYLLIKILKTALSSTSGEVLHDALQADILPETSLPKWLFLVV